MHGTGVPFALTPGYEHPCQGDVLELALVVEIVVDG